MGAFKNQATIEVTLNGAAAERELKNIQDNLKKLIDLRDKAMAAGDVTGYTKLNAEISKATKQAKSLEQQMTGVNAVMKNLSGSSLKELKEAQRILEAQVTQWKRGSAEQKHALNNLKLVNGEISSIRKEMYGTSTGTQKWGAGIKGILGDARSLLPAFGFAAIVAGAKVAFDKVIGATDFLSDKWEEVMSGMKSATGYFWLTLASGNWHNFFTNIAEAARLGANYAKILDALGDRQRSLTIQEADAQQKILDLEVKLKNKTLSKEERLAAGQERIRLEEELSAARTKNAEMAYNNELENNIKFKQLGKERTMQLLTDLDSEERARAEAYNKQVADYNAARSKNTYTRTIPGAGLSEKIQLPDTEEIKNLNKAIGETPQNIIDYAVSITQFDKITEEERDRLIKTYTDLKQAQNSAVENTKKVRTGVNTLLAGTESDQEKAGKKAISQKKEELDTILKALDEAYQERQLKIEQQHLQEQDSDANFKLNMSIAEQAYLEQKKAILENAGKSTIDIQRKLLEDDLALMKSMEEQMAASDGEFWDTFNAKKDAEADAVKAALDKSVDENIKAGEKLTKEQEAQKEKELSILQERKQAYIDLVGGIGDSLANVLSDSEASFGDFLKSTLVMALDALEKMMLLNITEAFMAGTVKGPIGWIAAAAKIIAVKAAFAVAKSAISGGGKKESKSKGYTEGGYTGSGFKDEPAGIVHKGEYVIPAAMVKNPAYSPVVDFIEINRRKDPLASLDIGAIQQVTSYRGYSEGGIVNADKLRVRRGFLDPYATDWEQNKVIKELAAAVNELTANSKKQVESNDRLMKWKPKVYTEMIKKDLETLNSIEKNRNL